jgi:hypothetical protein
LLFSCEASAREPGVTSLPAVAVDAPREKPRPIPRRNAAPARAAHVRPTHMPRSTRSPAPAPVVVRSPSSEGLHPAPSQAEIGNLPKAYAGGQMARGARLGMLGNRDMMDTPFNVTSYTSALIENQQARTLQDVMENDPSVRMTTPAGHMRENFRIRGFQVNGSELALNGMYGLAPDGHVPVEFLERVEVLKGPGALLNGMAPFGAIGGSVNLVTKHAGETPTSRITGDYTSHTQFGAHVDVARRFGDHGQFGVRYNGVYRGGETMLDGQWKQRGLNALGLDFREERFRLSLDAYHSTEIFRNGSSMIASFSGAGTATAPHSSTNLFLGSNSRFENGAVVGRGELDIAENVTVFAGIGFSSNDYGGFTNGTQAQNANPAGDYKWSIVNLRGYQNSLSSQGGVRGQFDTGPLHHQLVVSASSLSFTAGTKNTRTGQYSSNIYAPVVPPIAADPGDPTKTSQTHLASFAVADTISAFDERIQFTGGVRSQRVQTKNINPDTGQVALVNGQPNQYDRHALSPAFARRRDRPASWRRRPSARASESISPPPAPRSPLRRWRRRRVGAAKPVHPTAYGRRSLRAQATPRSQKWRAPRGRLRRAENAQAPRWLEIGSGRASSLRSIHRNERRSPCPRRSSISSSSSSPARPAAPASARRPRASISGRPPTPSSGRSAAPAADRSSHRSFRRSPEPRPMAVSTSPSSPDSWWGAASPARSSPRSSRSFATLWFSASAPEPPLRTQS